MRMYVWKCLFHVTFKSESASCFRSTNLMMKRPAGERNNTRNWQLRRRKEENSWSGKSRCQIWREGAKTPKEFRSQVNKEVKRLRKKWWTTRLDLIGNRNFQTESGKRNGSDKKCFILKSFLFSNRFSFFFLYHAKDNISKKWNCIIFKNEQKSFFLSCHDRVFLLLFDFYRWKSAKNGWKICCAECRESEDNFPVENRLTFSCKSSSATMTLVKKREEICKEIREKPRKVEF